MDFLKEKSTSNTSSIIHQIKCVTVRIQLLFLNKTFPINRKSHHRNTIKYLFSKELVTLCSSVFISCKELSY